MKCPICSADLSPLDLVSRTEHVDLCIEHGPAVVEVNETGQLVVKKTVPAAKKRLICPICDKTFTNLASHFKSCALKYDVPPQLMLTHWDQINSHAKVNKKFPRELLDNFVDKCIKEGRVGDQVDFARALSLSMAEGEDDDSQQATGTSRGRPRSGNSSVIQQQTNGDNAGLQQQHELSDASEPLTTTYPTAIATTTNTSVINANQVLMKNATVAKPRKRFRLELVGEDIKASNIALRIDRELAASRSKRYQETMKDARKIQEQLRDSGAPDTIQATQGDNDDDDDCVILLDTQYFSKISTSRSDAADELGKLFHRSRLKDCTGSEACLEARCTTHDIELLLEDFRIYSGSSMDAPPKTCPPEAATSQSSSSGDTRITTNPQTEADKIDHFETEAAIINDQDNVGSSCRADEKVVEAGSNSSGGDDDDDNDKADDICSNKKGSGEIEFQCRSQP